MVPVVLKATAPDMAPGFNKGVVSRRHKSSEDNGRPPRLPPGVGGVRDPGDDDRVRRCSLELSSLSSTLDPDGTDRGCIISKNKTAGISSRVPYCHHHETFSGGASTLRANPNVWNPSTTTHNTLQTDNLTARAEYCERLGCSKRRSRGQK